MHICRECLYRISAPVGSVHKYSQTAHCGWHRPQQAPSHQPEWPEMARVGWTPGWTPSSDVLRSFFYPVPCTLLSLDVSGLMFQDAIREATLNIHLDKLTTVYWHLSRKTFWGYWNWSMTTLKYIGLKITQMHANVWNAPWIVSLLNQLEK